MTNDTTAEQDAERELLARIKAKWDEGKGDDTRRIARDMAREYVEAHRARLTELFGDFSREQLVVLVDRYREAGRDLDVQVIDAWLLSEFSPVLIRGQVEVEVLDQRAPGTPTPGPLPSLTL